LRCFNIIEQDLNETVSTTEEKPFYKTKEFWFELAKIAARAGVAFGVTYLANKQKNGK
jgi:hypothetical protein